MHEMIAQAATAAPHPEGWVAIGLSVISALTTLILALLRRPSAGKIASSDKRSSEALSIAQANSKTLVDLDLHVSDLEAKVADLDAKLDDTDPGFATRDERLNGLAQDLAAVKRALEERAKHQSQQDIRLAETLARIDENIKHLKERIDDHAAGERSSRRR